MKKLFSIFLLFLTTSAFGSSWPINDPADNFTVCDGTWNYSGTVDVVTDTTDPNSPPNVWRFTFPSDIVSADIAMVYYGFASSKDELWVQYWFKYSGGFNYHDIANKQVYFYTTGFGVTTNSNLMLALNSERQMNITPQGSDFANYPPNINTSTWYTDVPGSWHKVKAYFRFNTGANWDGLYKLWIDDVLVSDYSNVAYDRRSEVTHSWEGFGIRPIWGGMSSETPGQVQYLYVNGMYAGATDPGGTTTADINPPYTDQHSPAKGATGVDNTNRTISFHVKDNLPYDNGVNSSTIVSSIEGVNKTCASGLTCTGGPFDVTVTYTNGTDWASGQTVDVINNVTDTVGNIMPTETYSFQIATAASKTYSTSFPATENPISESGSWVSGGVSGGAFTDVRTASGNALSTDNDAIAYNDSVAILADTTWPPDQTVSGIVYAVNRTGAGTSGYGDGCSHEVELHLRGDISTGSSTGYEILFSSPLASLGGVAWQEIVRWNGARGDFTYLSQLYGSQYEVVTGDNVMATITGNVINVYKNGALINTATDSTFPIGRPGMGFYTSSGCVAGAHNDDFGFSSFAASATGTATLNILTTSLPDGTVGVHDTWVMSATGGTPPYTWSVLSGAMPPGKTLSSSGVYSAPPTVEGTYNFTVKVVDAIGGTDNQALTHYIAPVPPTGQTVVTITDIADTYINSGAATTNFSDNTEFRTYQWPAQVVANQGLDNISLSSLPSNISITAATLELYLTGYDGGGGTNPMRTYVYRVTGSVPNISTVTWNTFAGTVGMAESYTDVSLTPGWFSFNVREMVMAAYAAGTPLYVAIDGGPDGTQDTNRIFASMNHGTTAWRPRLKVTYTQLVGPPPASSVLTPGKARAVTFGGILY